MTIRRHWLPQLTRRLGIGWLFAAAMIPGVVAGSILFREIYLSGRGQLEQSALQTARALSLAVDRELAGIRGKLQILATSPFLKKGDLQTFYRQSQEVLATEGLAGAIVLIDGTGQQVINTLRPFGSALPKTGHPNMLRRTFETGRPSVSDVYIGGVARRPFVAIEVPVLSDGKVIYAIDMGIPPERLTQLLVDQSLPPSWVAGLMDSQGIFIARSKNATDNVGKPGTPDFLAAMSQRNEGTLESHNLEGHPTFAAFSRSSASGWTVGVGVTRAVLHANLYRDLALAGLTLLAFLLGGAILAWVFTRHLREALGKLKIATEAGASGDLEATAPLVGPREIVELAKQFNEMQRARKLAEKQLMDNEMVLEATVAERTAEVRRLAAEVTYAEERERQAVARDLHDDLGQVLHVARLRVDLLGKEALSANGQSLVEETAALVADASRQVRSLTSHLSPPILATLGLPAALRWLCDEIQQTYALPIVCRADVRDTGLSPAQSAILFRAARELLINVAKHSESDSASLELRHDDSTLTLVVEDSGNGVPVCEATLATSKGFGLTSVRERIAFMGGKMNIETPVGGGLRVVLQMPLESQANIPEVQA